MAQQYGKITQTAMYVPENKVTNQELEKIMDTSDEWIVSRTGIQSRHISLTENTSDLCSKVAERILEKSQYSASELDFILVATMTPDYATPSTACLVQSKIEAKNAFAMDISAACSGFVYALSVGEKMIRSGVYNKGLVIGGETLSKVIDWQDRATAVLFGDGAAGVLLEAANQPHLLAEKLCSDGSRGLSLTSNEQKLHSKFSKVNDLENQSYLQMDGRAIFDFALRDVSQNILDTLEKVEMQASELDFLLLHQANQRIIKKIAQKTKIPQTKFLTNMQFYGNTSAASIPILLHEAVDKKQIKLGSNQKVLFTGYGGGLTWGSLVFQL